MKRMHNKMAKHIYIDPTLNEAIKSNQPVVALESTIICHGMPYPKNIETAIEVESIIKKHGGIPATIAIIDGCLKVGLSSDEMQILAKNGDNVKKISRRDIPICIASRENGATTVSASMIISSMAGINIFATGGIGGVHRDVNSSLDISADLQELAQTNVAVVCSGVKSILDIPKTLEYLETQGVPVIGYKTNMMPAFYVSKSECKVDYRCENPEEVARIIKIKKDVNLRGGVLIANPIPEEYSIDESEINTAIEEALKETEKRGISGKLITPFLLKMVAEKTEGGSLNSNIKLIQNNALIATEISKKYSEFLGN